MAGMTVRPALFWLSNAIDHALAARFIWSKPIETMAHLVVHKERNCGF
jgi:hypothetical protein